MAIPLWTASVAKRGLWKTLRCAFAWVLGLILFGVICYGVLAGKFWAWRASVWKDRAEEAAGEVVVAQRQAKSSEQGAANATLTREQMDLLMAIGRGAAGDSAGRMDDYANRPDRPTAPGDDDVPDDVVLQELEGAEDAYRAAADRLQRARAR